LPLLELRDTTEALRAPGRAFVTLRRGNRLRGCVGFLEPVRPVWEAVAQAAHAAAHEDERFQPVAPEELPDLTIEVSLLSPPRVVEDPTAVIPGRHGVIVSRGSRRGLLLPQTAVEQGWDREDFLGYACLKAGLPREAWKGPEARIQVFETRVYVQGPRRTASLTGEP
jgi:AmmeMemoRadiSam system protein A